MKWIAVVLVALSPAAGSVGAIAYDADGRQGSLGFFARFEAYQELNLGRVERNFEQALEHSVDGVVESAIAQLAMVKLAQPECESEDLSDKLAELAGNGRTPAIRFKAYLASMLFEQPGIFAADARTHYDSGEKLFAALASRLEQTLLVEK